MDQMAATEERIVTKRLRQKLNEVNSAAQTQLSPIQDHVNFTLKETLRVKDEELQNLARDSTIRELADKLSEIVEAAKSAAFAAHTMDNHRRIALAEVERLKRDSGKQLESSLLKVPRGTLRDSFLVNGVAFKKKFSYADFEQQPKKFENPKILLLNIELELNSEKENTEIRLSDPLQYQSIIDAEGNIIYDKLDKCVKSGAKIVLSRLAIGDLATHYFADRDIFCAGRVSEEDLHRVAAATSGTVQTSVNNVIDEVLGIKCSKP